METRTRCDLSPSSANASIAAPQESENHMLRTERAPQTYANHRKIIPLYHVAVFAILLLNIYWTGKNVLHEASMDTIVPLLLALALLVMFLALRTFPVVVQDRVIRLEMLMRLADALPSDLKPRICELSVRQLIALRFAGNGELPELVRQVLDQKIESGEAIKRMIKDWQPDYLRC
jgi:hypothetical protein